MNEKDLFEDKLMELFTNVSSVRIMYCMAKHDNPLAIKTISEKTEIPKKEISVWLRKMIKQDIAHKLPKRKYDLTDKGYCALYNFHITYYKKVNK